MMATMVDNVTVHIITTAIMVVMATAITQSTIVMRVGTHIMVVIATIGIRTVMSHPVYAMVIAAPAW